MRRISSAATPILKRFLPKVLLAVALCIAIGAAVWMLSSGRFIREAAFVPVAIAAAAIAMRAFFAETIDEVWDAGDSLVIKSGADEERIPLTAICRVTHSTARNPPTITLWLDRASRFGREITFVADADHLRMVSPHSSIFDDLSARIANPRNG